MTHKDYMNQLKKNDPMLYYELTSDPTGASGDDSFGCVVFIIILIIAVGIGFYFFGGK
jgi:hypothetical protein|nr:MAG TPA: Protein melan-A [Caudoviricetes sp.]